MLCAMLKILLPPNPGNVGNALFDCLANFVEATMEEDKSFIIFPLCLSKYQLATNLPKWIVDIKTLPKEVNKWLPYFLQAKLQTKGEVLYTPILMGLSQPFLKFIKKLSPWCKEKRFGLWQSCLQSEKPVSMGWLLFLTNMMDMENLQQAIMENIQDIPVGLW